MYGSHPLHDAFTYIPPVSSEFGTCVKCVWNMRKHASTIYVPVQEADLVLFNMPWTRSLHSFSEALNGAASFCRKNFLDTTAEGGYLSGEIQKC